MDSFLMELLNISFEALPWIIIYILRVSHPRAPIEYWPSLRNCLESYTFAVISFNVGGKGTWPSKVLLRTYAQNYFPSFFEPSSGII